MKKMILALILGSISASAYALESVEGDLFPYENKHSSFSVTIDAGQFDRFSIQVVYSTPTVADVQFTNNNVDVANDTIYGASHGIATAQPVLLSTAGTTGLVPLKAGTTYFAIRTSDNLIQLATTYAQAVSRDNINILSAAAGAWTLRPLALGLGSSGYLWHGSNDGTNWTQVPSVGYTVATSTQALTVMGSYGGSRLHDWGEYAYKYLKFTFNGPATGVIKLRAYLNAKRRE